MRIGVHPFAAPADKCGDTPVADSSSVRFPIQSEPIHLGDFAPLFPWCTETEDVHANPPQVPNPFLSQPSFTLPLNSTLFLLYLGENFSPWFVHCQVL